jgi:pimeloyl-ACP methyl ester carboxylesterase
MAKRAMTDVVVVLPGITGSVLRKDGRDVWSMTAGAAVNALFTLGKSITDLELRDDEADDGVTAPMVMPDLHLIPGLWKIDGYAKLSRYILDQFEVTPNQNFFQFPYDWRRDNRVAARQLKDNTDRWLHAWRQRYPQAKLILVGHSMGGLVSRYFLECLEGWRDTKTLVTFGTPYRGSLNALDFLVHGMKKTLGPITLLDLSRLLRSFTSVYQLLPIYPCLDVGERDLLRVSKATGLPNVDPERAMAADEFHREIERAVAAHLDDEQYRRDRYGIRSIVGTFQPTLLSARQSNGGIEMLREHPDQDPDGDGTVARVSATPIEFSQEEGAMFAAERHGSLQNNDSVLVQLAGLLSVRDTSRVRAGPGSGISLDIEDAFGPEEPVAFRVRSEDPTAELTILLSRADTGAEVARVELRPGDGWRAGEVSPLPPGSYRMTVVGQSSVEPVTDAFVVLPAAEPEGGEVVGVAAGRTVRGGIVIEGRAEIGPVSAGGKVAGVKVDVAQPPAAPGLEQRHLHGRFPERVRLGEVASLLVRVGVEGAESRSAALRPVEIPVEGVDVSLIVHSPGFTPRSPQHLTIRVFPGADSDWMLFELEAAQEGVHTIEVMAFLGGTYLGALAVQCTIEADIRTGASVDRSAPVGGRARDPGEVSLIIYYDPESSVYRYQLVDWSGGFPEPSESHRLLQTPYQAVEGLVAQLNALARGAIPWDAKTTTEWLQGQGIQLWDQFIPEALQREFWDRRDRISRLSIVSAGDPVPWELLYPFAPGGYDAGFLVDQFSVARWVFGDGPPSRLQLSRGGLVLSGQGSLESAPTEIQAIAQLLGERNVPTETMGELPALLDLFAGGNFGLLHFTCHNSFGVSANSSQIMMGTQPFQPVFLARYRERFRQRSPMVFMNACRTDGQAPLYTRLDGWALSFLGAGAGAFVGSLWEVVDSSASLYAQEFYRVALSGETLGEAARKARAAIREEPGDPTWLAYALYGDPAATVVPA